MENGVGGKRPYIGNGGVGMGRRAGECITVALYSGDAPPHASPPATSTSPTVPRPRGALGRAPWIPGRMGTPHGPRGNPT